MLFRYRIGNEQGNKVTCYLSGNLYPQSSEFTELLLTDLGLKGGIHVCEWTSTEKKERKAHEGVIH